MSGVDKTCFAFTFFNQFTLKGIFVPEILPFFTCLVVIPKNAKISIIRIKILKFYCDQCFQIPKQKHCKIAFVVVIIFLHLKHVYI